MASAYILIMILELGVLVAVWFYYKQASCICYCYIHHYYCTQFLVKQGLIWLWSSSAAVYCVCHLIIFIFAKKTFELTQFIHTIFNVQKTNVATLYEHTDLFCQSMICDGSLCHTFYLKVVLKLYNRGLLFLFQLYWVYMVFEPYWVLHL